MVRCQVAGDRCGVIHVINEIIALITELSTAQAAQLYGSHFYGLSVTRRGHTFTHYTWCQVWVDAMRHHTRHLPFYDLLHIAHGMTSDKMR